MRHNKSINTNMLLGFIFIVISAAFFVAGLRYQPESAPVPKIVSVVMGVLSAVLIVQGMFEQRTAARAAAASRAAQPKTEAGLSENKPETQAHSFFTKQFFICFGGIMALGVLLYYVGFVIAAVVFCTGMTVFLRAAKPLLTLLLFAVLIGLIYLIFFYLLGVAYPTGVLWE